MPSQPLTHHEILGLIEPFSQAGYRADLAASQRLHRRLSFVPVTVAGPGAIGPLLETLTLSQDGRTGFTLERELAPGRGPAARVTAQGSDPAALLAEVRSVDPALLFDEGPGFQIGYAGRAGATAADFRLSEVTVQVGEWRLVLEADPVRGMPADLSLRRRGRGSVAVPEDLLAVLGRRWRLLRPTGESWTGAVRLSGDGASRDALVRQLAIAAARHLESTFLAAPESFHLTHRRARWRVVARRLLPLAGALVLVGIGAACARLDISRDATLRVLLMSSPPLLMILFFSLREVPRLELPPVPRTLNAGQWTPARTVDGTGSANEQ